MNGNSTKNIDSHLKEVFNGFEVQPAPEMLNNILGQHFDNAVQNSFEGFAFAPRPQVWEQIGEAIPTGKDKIFSDSFKSFEVAPPTSMWATIQGELDIAENFDAKFQNAFGDFEAMPSNHILQNVLNHEFDTGVRRSFMRHEAEPREAVWQRIKPLIPFSSVVLRRHFHTFMKVAAVLLLMLSFVFLYDNYQYNSNQPVAKSDPPNQSTNRVTSIQQIQNSELKQPLKIVPGEASQERLALVEKQPVTHEVVRQSGEIDESISQSSSVGSGSFQSDSGGTSLPPVFRGRLSGFAPQSLNTVIPIANEPTTRPTDLISSIPTLKVVQLERNLPTLQPNINFNEDIELLEVSTAFGGLGKEFAARTIESNLVDMAEDNDLTRMMLSYRGWYVSSTFSLYNSRIINEDIREGLTDQTPVNYAVDLGRSFGFGAGYQFSPNFGIEAEFVSSRLSQKYTELTVLNASNPSNAIANYYYLPIAIKYQTHRLNSLNKRVPQTLSVVIGAHYGQLRSSNITSKYMSLPESVTNSFIQQEVGAFMGGDYNFYMHPNIHFTLGFRAAAGTDVNNLSELLAAGTSYNVQLGGRVGLSYRFASRQDKWRHGVYY